MLIKDIIKPDFLEKRSIKELIIAWGKYIRGDIFDIGCGEMPYKNILKCNKYIGLDKNSDKADIKESYDDFFAKIDNKYYDYKDNFDCVFSTQVLEHIEEPNIFFELSKSLLKKYGYLVFSCPQTWEMHEIPRDYYRYTKYGILYLLKKNNLECIKIISRGGSFMSIFQQINIVLIKPNFGKLRYIIYPFIILNNILGLILDKIVYIPDNTLGYLVIAKKI